MDANKTTILVIGGSQGAHSINKAIEKNLEVFKKAGVQLLWQTGPSYFPQAADAVSRFNTKGIQAVDFIREMDLAYAIADIAISRAGAIASAELAAVGKPVIFVPLPTAAEDHQTKNARAFEEKGAAILVPNSEVSSQIPVLLPARSVSPHSGHPQRPARPPCRLIVQHPGRFSSPARRDSVFSDPLRVCRPASPNAHAKYHMAVPAAPCGLGNVHDH